MQHKPVHAPFHFVFCFATHVFMDAFNYHYQPGIVFKVKYQQAVPGDAEQDTTKFFRYHANAEWRNLFLAHPQIQVRKMFCTLQPSELAPLIEKAKQLHPGYQDPELLSYFILLCPSDAAAKKLLAALLQMEQVETAYIRGNTTGPAVAVKKNGGLANKAT